MPVHSFTLPSVSSPPPLSLSPKPHVCSPRSLSCLSQQRFKYGDPGAMIVTLTELTIMAPLCFLTYRAIVLDRPYTRVLVATTSMLQLAGTIVFVGAEVLAGMHNVPIDWHFEFTFDYSFYFWFGFVFANGIWFVVTTFLIWRAIAQRAASAALADAIASALDRDGRRA